MKLCNQTQLSKLTDALSTTYTFSKEERLTRLKEISKRILSQLAQPESVKDIKLILDKSLFYKSQNEWKDIISPKHEDFPVFGQAIYTPQQRKENVLHMAQETGFPIDHSSVLELILDYYNDLCSKNIGFKKKPKQLKNNSNPHNIDPYFYFHRYMRCLFQYLMSSDIRSLTLNKNLTIKQINELREYSLEIVDEIFSKNKIRIQLEKPGNQYSLLLLTLKDFICQDFYTLYAPFNTQNNNAPSGCRLKFRVESLNRTLSDLKNCHLTNKYFSKHKNHKPIWSNFLVEIEKSNHLINTTLQNTNKNQFNEIEKTRNHSKTSKKYKQLCQLIDNDPDTTDYYFMRSTINYLSHIYNYTNANVCFYCYYLKIASGEITTKDIENFLEKMRISYDAFQNSTKLAIQKSIENISPKNLSENDLLYFTCLLNSLSNSKVEESFYKLETDLINSKLSKCKKPGAGPLEWAEALVENERALRLKPNIETAIDVLTAYRRTFFPRGTVVAEVQSLSDKIFEFFQMQMEIVNGVEAQIRFMSENQSEPINENPPADDQTSQEVVTIRQKNHKKKKKTKKRKKASKRNKKESVIPEEKAHDNQSEEINKSNILAQDEKTDFTLKNEKREPADIQITENVDVYASLRKYLKLLRFMTPPPSFEQYFNATLKNTKHVIRHLEETSEQHDFDMNKIFGETDTLRLLMEGVLGLAATLCDDQETDPIKDFVHDLHKYVVHIYRHATQENLRQTMMQKWKIPYAFTQANACINYLHSTRMKTKITTETLHLADFLLLVEAENKSKYPNKELQAKLLETHEKQKTQILTFVTEILHDLVDPAYMPEKNEAQEPILLEEVDHMSMRNFENEPEELQSINTVSPSVINHMIEIHTRKDAVDAVDSALNWLRIRSIPPVEGHVSQMQRKRERDLALENVEVYLLWLRNKLTSETYTTLYDSIVEEMKLMRRAHKELGIALLYHGNFFKDGSHIVEAENMRYKNNPCSINRTLLQYSSQAPYLPDLHDLKYLWMKEAHQWLTYPVAQRPMANESPWAKQVCRVVEKVKKLSQKKRGVEKENAEAVQKEIELFVRSKEEEKVFTSLAALLQTLLYSTPLRGQ